MSSRQREHGLTERTLTLRLHIADLEQYLDKELGVSAWHEITQDRINAFARATGDEQWIHTDPERARTDSPFGGTIAHGYLTLSLAPMLMDEIIDVMDARFLVNPGVERLRLRAAVPCGARVRMRATLKRVRYLPEGRARVRIHLAFEIDGSERPCAHADANIVYYP